MANPINRDILNRETDTRFWAQSGHKPGQQLDPKNPLDAKMIPVWKDIYNKVKAAADAGTLVTTYDRPEVAQPLADAEIASTVAAAHIDAAAKAPDPTTAQQHAAAATTASQVASQKLNEAAANQPSTMSPKLEHEAVREIAKTPPPPHAPAADHIAHAQAQNGQARNGQAQNGQLLRPEDDPWDPRYVPKSKLPREQPPTQPSKSPRARPSREILYKETNERFWNRTQHKRGQKLDMADPQDVKMAKIWMEIFREVEREANEGRLTFTRPELVPTPDAAWPPPIRPTPPPGPTPLRPTPPPLRPTPPPQRPTPPPQQPMPPGTQQPVPQQQPMPPQQMPTWPLWMPRLPWMQQPIPQPGTQQPMPQRPTPPEQPQRMPPGTQPRPPAGTQPPTQPDTQPPTGEPPIPGGAPTEPTTEGAPAETGMSGGTIALIALGLAGAAGIAYAVTRKPAGRTVSFRPRAKSTMAATGVSSAFPPSRGGRY